MSGDFRCIKNTGFPTIPSRPLTWQSLFDRRKFHSSILNVGETTVRKHLRIYKITEYSSSSIKVIKRIQKASNTEVENYSMVSLNSTVGTRAEWSFLSEIVRPQSKKYAKVNWRFDASELEMRICVSQTSRTLENY